MKRYGLIFNLLLIIFLVSFISAECSEGETFDEASGTCLHVDYYCPAETEINFETGKCECLNEGETFDEASGTCLHVDTSDPSLKIGFWQKLANWFKNLFS